MFMFTKILLIVRLCYVHTWYSNTKMAKYKTIEINHISEDCIIKMVALKKKNKPKPLSFSASQ